MLIYLFIYKQKKLFLAIWLISCPDPFIVLLRHLGSTANGAGSISSKEVDWNKWIIIGRKV
jgi:hypothetical protein